MERPGLLQPRRNLHRCAQAVVAEHGGAFPRASRQLATLPGIGRSTAAAIAAFCFGERVAIPDNNVKRVLTRARLWRRSGRGRAGAPAVGAATDLLPARAASRPTQQGLMDLGATLCLARSPHCLICPVRGELRGARREGRPERYPVKTRKLEARKRTRERVAVAALADATGWCSGPRAACGPGLWSLPSSTAPGAGRGLAGLAGRRRGAAGFTHVLTHLDWTLHPRRWTFPAQMPQQRSSASSPPADGPLVQHRRPGAPACPRRCASCWNAT